MNKNLIINGPQCSGKSFIASALLMKYHPNYILQLIVRERNTILGLLKNCHSNTKYIVFEEVSKHGVMEEIMSLTSNGVQLKNGLTIYPRIIVMLDTTSFLLNDSYSRRFNVLNTKLDKISDLMNIVESWNNWDNQNELENISPCDISKDIGKDFYLWANSFFENYNFGTFIQIDEAKTSFESGNSTVISYSTFLLKLKMWCHVFGYKFNQTDCTNDSGRIFKKVDNRTTEFIFISKQKEVSDGK